MDVVSRIISYLGGALESATVSHDTHSDRDKLAGGETVTVARVGGPCSKFLDEPRITIDCYAQSSWTAYQLAMRVAKLLAAMPDTDGKVSSVSIQSVYRNEWTADGTPCYSVSASMVVNV